MSSIRVIKFWTEYKLKDGQMVGVDMVEYCGVGRAQNATNIEVVSRLGRVNPAAAVDNPAAKMAVDRWAAIEPAYHAWKSGQEVPLNGTPLAAWSGVTPEQADVLKRSQIRTLEELSDASELVITQVPLPGMRALRDMARLFLASTEKTAVVDDLRRKDEQIAVLNEQMEELRQIILAQAEKEQEQRPRRGRPPKADVDAHTEQAP